MLMVLVLVVVGFKEVEEEETKGANINSGIKIVM